MRKQMPVLILILIIICTAVLTYTLHRSISRSVDQDISSTPLPKDLPTQLLTKWQTYQSSEWNFSIKHPLDVKPELTQNGVHFLKLGETQSTGTELFDGLSLLIFSAPLPQTTFDAFVRKEYQQEKNDPTTDAITDLRKTTIAGHSGYTYAVTSLGKRTVIYLPKEKSAYLKIADSTVEPTSVKRDFHETVRKMLSTLTY